LTTAWPTLQIRRVQRTSDGTFFVTLPKSWVTTHGVERGTLLAFAEGKDGKLSVGMYGEQDRASRSVTLQAGPTLEREIEEKYLLGYDVVQIESTAVMHSELRDNVKAILKKLVGLEIVEEDAHKIILQCLIEPSLLAPEKIIRRLHLITKAMQQDALAAFVNCEHKLATTVVERDEEVDRLYFLLVRIVRDALTDLSTAERVHASPVDCLDYRILASLIEHIGDYSASIAMNVPETQRGFSKQLSRSLERSGKVVGSMYANSVEAVLSRNLELVSEVEDLHRKALAEIREAERALLRLGPSLLDKTTSTVSSLKSMCEINVDIADLAMTR
jgi:phosphate uptake regulator